MELSSPATIQLLMQDCRKPAVRRNRGEGQVDRSPCYTVRSTVRGRSRCKCGQCSQCRDDARWDRIFAEKFEDPEYYSRPVVRIASPLTSL